MNISQGNKRKIRDLLYSWRFPRDILFCQWKLGTWQASWRFMGLPIIRRHRSATIKVGKNWIACSDPRHNSIGVFQKVTITALNPKSKLIIGDNVGMSGVSISCGESVKIGDNVLLGSGVLITDNDAHPLHPDERENAALIGTREVIIGKGAFIGARAIVMKGVTIGEGSVVGAGAVVTKNVPPFSIAAGNPAKVIGPVERKGESTSLK